MKLRALLAAGAVALCLAVVCRASGARAADASATPTPAPGATPPISIELCSAEQQSQNNPNLKVGLAFRDLTNVMAVQVKFDLLLLDSSGNAVETRVESIDGKFAPNELIQPRRASVGGVLLTQPEYPESPAWNVPSHFGSPAQRVSCAVHSAKFSDGTTWDRSKP